MVEIGLMNDSRSAHRTSGITSAQNERCVRLSALQGKDCKSGVGATGPLMKPGEARTGTLRKSYNDDVP
jgi:hypothetical protein